MSSNHAVGAYTTFGPLREVIVGDYYPVEYFDIIPDDRFREDVQRIVSETHQDIRRYVDVLEQHGVRVHRPRMMFDRPAAVSNGAIDIVNPRPLYAPMDNLYFIDNKILSIYTSFQPSRFFDDLAVQHILQDLVQRGAEWHVMPKNYCPEFGSLEDNTWPFWDGSNMQALGDTILHTVEETGNRLGLDWIKATLGPSFRYRELSDKRIWRNHLDGHIKIVRPGLLLSTFSRDAVVREVPEMANWTIIEVHRELEQVMDYYTNLMQGYRDQNSTYEDWVALGRQHCSGWLTDWQDDDMANTTFGVGLTSIDENTLVIPFENVEFERTMARHGVRVIPVNYRHLFFWGNGLTCLTAVIKRDDERINYLD